jgi:hypothetical protein
MKRIHQFILVVALTVSVHAESVWHGNLKVTQAWSAQDKDRVVFMIEEDASGSEVYKNPANCANTTYYEVAVPYDRKTALSILLTALTTQKDINVYVVDNQCGVFNQPVVSTVVIKR